VARVPLNFSSPDLDCLSKQERQRKFEISTPPTDARLLVLLVKAWTKQYCELLCSRKDMLTQAFYHNFEKYTFWMLCENRLHNVNISYICKAHEINDTSCLKLLCECNGTEIHVLCFAIQV